MSDQAEKLRMMMNGEGNRSAKTLAVVSGKGGVGKSNISINTALLLTKKGYKVLLFDLDIGMGNVNILLGSSQPKTIADFLEGDMPIADIIQKSDEGLSYIAGGNGLNEAAEMDRRLAEKLLSGLETIQQQYDYVIFDMAAGAAAFSLQILLAADDILVVTTPEPTAVMDAYSMIKFICLEESGGRFLLVCNRADSQSQGNETLKKLQSVTKQFLHRDVVLFGILPEDKHVRKAVIEQRALCLSYPHSPAAESLSSMIGRYVEGAEEAAHDGKETFISRVRRLFLGREERGWRK